MIISATIKALRKVNPRGSGSSPFFWLLAGVKQRGRQQNSVPAADNGVGSTAKRR
ncbi:hypothetical protein EaACW_1489 [Erwinia amylovora ACW56400]|nr:hypothetical protein EaACW_1489 [Erwinia amylovora ACW56400]CCO78336.1 hypothetical protein BN432_1533 [Erwinia amylovora Ea356]CCO85921.1 hypothetical protein BN434_1528 [Erwinia amylovora CFBP 2585]CCO89709.1 hypothetical protein BN435_1532 [Erwinia amylovora 01SFR-BO]CCO98818.1 hypothetical protein BN438_1531 [Erwinia amylovora UPN527]